MHSTVFSEGGLAGCMAHDVSLECTPTGAGVCASGFDKMPLTSKAVFDYKCMSVLVMDLCTISLQAE